MLLEHIQRTQQEIKAVEQQMRELVTQSSHKKVTPEVELQSPLQNDCDVWAPNLGSIRDDNVTLKKWLIYDIMNGGNSRLDYKTHFDTRAEINNWSLSEKGLYLAVSLRGQAHEVIGNLISKS